MHVRTWLGMNYLCAFFITDHLHAMSSHFFFIGSGVPIPGMYGASTTSGYSPTTSICQTESHLQPLPPICTATKPLSQSFTAPCIPSSGRQNTHAGAHLPPGGIPYPQLMNFPMMSVAPQQMSHEGDTQGYSGAFQSCAVHEN